MAPTDGGGTARVAVAPHGWQWHRTGGGTY